MKKVIISIFLLFTLVSCWTSDTTDSNTKSFQWNWFNIKIPSSWIQEEINNLPALKNWKVELALTSSDINAGFANNMVILSEGITNNITSVKYSEINYIRTTWVVIDYKKLDEKLVKFQDNDEWKIYIFEAKYWTQTPKRKFLQVAKICNKKAYLATIGLNLDNDSLSKYEDLLKSFECKK